MNIRRHAADCNSLPHMSAQIHTAELNVVKSQPKCKPRYCRRFAGSRRPPRITSDA